MISGVYECSFLLSEQDIHDVTAVVTIMTIDFLREIVQQELFGNDWIVNGSWR